MGAGSEVSIPGLEPSSVQYFLHITDSINTPSQSDYENINYFRPGKCPQQ
jgi:hypothetical protein